MQNTLTLSIIDGSYAVCKLEGNAPTPDWINKNSFHSITRTEDELSVVCLDHDLPDEVQTEPGWKIIKVLGPLDFSLVGILHSILTPLKDAGVSVFAISTFETDYILLKEKNLPESMRALKNAGLSFRL